MLISAVRTMQVTSMKNKRLLVVFFAVLAVILLVLSAVFLLADEEAEPDLVREEIPTVRILTIGEIHSNELARISDAISEITAEQVGCRVELRMIREDEYDERIDDLLLESDFADIFVCRNRTTMNKLMAGSYIYRLDRYLKKFPELCAAIANETDWEHVKSQGYTYGIPFGNNGNSAWGFVMREDICAELGIDPSVITTLEKLHAVLLKVREAHPEIIPVVSDYGEAHTFADEDLLIEGAGCLTANGEVVNVCDMPEFMQRSTMMERWYEEGLIIPNAQLNQAGRDRWMKNGLAFGSFAQLDRYTARELEYVVGSPVECATLDEVYFGNDHFDMSFALYAYTEDVDLCLRVLELIYTDDDVLKLCIYGEEGVDYTLSSDGAVLPTQDCRYYNWCWAMRDAVPAPISNEDPAWFGRQEGRFNFDNRLVSNEIYQCGEILGKYYEAICSGAIDAENGISRMCDELRSANQSTVQNELSKQWNIWKNSN